MFQSINTFIELFDVGTRLEDAVREGKIKREDFSSRRGKMPTYHQENYVNPTDVNALNQPKNGQAIGYRSRDKKFIDLEISLSTVSDRLVTKGHLKVLEARPPPKPPPLGF